MYWNPISDVHHGHAARMYVYVVGSVGIVLLVVVVVVVVVLLVVAEVADIAVHFFLPHFSRF